MGTYTMLTVWFVTGQLRLDLRSLAVQANGVRESGRVPEVAFDVELPGD